MDLVSEFYEFKPRLKYPQNRFQFELGLRLFCFWLIFFIFFQSQNLASCN